MTQRGETYRIARASRRSGSIACAAACALLAFACADELPTAPVRPTAPAPRTGSIEIVLTIVGKDVDPDGFIVRVDDGSPRIVTHGSRVVFADLAPGAYTVRVEGIAENCTLRERNPYRTAITAGQVRTIFFNADCLTHGTGAIRVRTSQGFEHFGVIIGESVVNTTAGVLEVTELLPGGHFVQLLVDPGACALSGENPRSTTVVAGRITEVHFFLFCFLTVDVKTTGTNQPASFSACIAMLDTYYDYGEVCEFVSANGTTRFEVSPGWEYRISLRGVPSNCTASPAAHTVAVPTRDQGFAAFAVACS
ncbi:MAG: hypothetical protein L0271_01390 [Gemmatimonadetes bacterium]|nr:hypothetical protein [Gemmatimonadota bacterium]